MSVLAKWDPFKELETFSGRLSSLFGKSMAQERDDDNLRNPTKWLPVVDISEDDQEYLIKAELPGIAKEQIEVTVDTAENGVLMITGERSSEKEEKNTRYHRSERSYGTFVRSFALPPDADSTRINAEFINGVLKVHLPKDENAKPRSIEIKVN